MRPSANAFKTGSCMPLAVLALWGHRRALGLRAHAVVSAVALTQAGSSALEQSTAAFSQHRELLVQIQFKPEGAAFALFAFHSKLGLVHQ